MSKTIEILNINPQLIKEIRSIIKEKTNEDPPDTFIRSIILFCKTYDMTDSEILAVLKATLNTKSDFVFAPPTIH